MPRRITLEPHLNAPELEQRYRQAKEPVERSHFQILWQLSQGRNAEEVADLTGYTAVWIRQLAKRYNQDGPEAMGDQRRHNPGGKFLLSNEQQAQLKEAIITGSTAEGGLWSCRTVAEWIEKQTGRKVSAQRGWDYLRLLGLSPQVPRARHYKADPDAQDAFKKNSVPGSRPSTGRAPRSRGGTLGF